jgi:transposase
MKNYFIGIDVSKKTLDVALHSLEGKLNCNHIVIENNAKGFKNLLSWLKKMKINHQDVLICMEHTGIYANKVVDFLETKNIAYSLQSALHVKKSLGLVRGKSDKVDAFRLAEFCYEKRDTIKESQKPSKNIIVLKNLFTERRKLVGSQAEYKQIRSEIAIYQGKDFLKRKNRIIKHFQREIDEIEEEIMEIIKSDPEIYCNFLLITSIIGIGMVNAVGTIVYTNNFKNFSDPRAYACYVGVAPFPHSSGTSINKRKSVSKMGRLQLKADLSQAARSAILYDPQMKAYFKRKFNGKKGAESNYGTVLNAVKFKLICRIFAVVRRQSAYIKFAF